MKLARYKQIADYPGSSFSVGDEIKVYANVGMAYVVYVGDKSEKYDIRDFPHIFELISDDKEQDGGEITCPGCGDTECGGECEMSDMDFNN